MVVRAQAQAAARTQRADGDIGDGERVGVGNRHRAVVGAGRGDGAGQDHIAARAFAGIVAAVHRDQPGGRDQGASRLRDAAPLQQHVARGGSDIAIAEHQCAITGLDGHGSGAHIAG